MSDDKLVRVTDIVTTAEGFSQRVEQIVDSAGNMLGEVDRTPFVRCDDGDCTLKMGHEGQHFNGTERWGIPTQCKRYFKGKRCVLDSGHDPVLHTTGDDTWADDASDLVVASEGQPPIKKMSIADIPRPEGQFLTAADIARFAGGNAPVVKPQPTKKQPWTVSIGTPIPPRQTVTVQQPMQLMFKAKQMMCAADGGRVYLRNIFVGQKVQLMQWNENGMRVDFLKDKIAVNFDVCPPGLFITVQLENRSDEPANFDMTLFGEAIT